MSEKKQPRKPYAKPTVRSYRVFEQNSLACAKVQGSFACRRGPTKSS